MGWRSHFIMTIDELRAYLDEHLGPEPTDAGLAVALELRDKISTRVLEALATERARIVRRMLTLGCSLVVVRGQNYIPRRGRPTVDHARKAGVALSLAASMARMRCINAATVKLERETIVADARGVVALYATASIPKRWHRDEVKRLVTTLASLGTE